MPFRRSSGSDDSKNPGLTPIDDAHGADRVVRRFEPDTTTGQLPDQDESNDTEMRKRRRSSKKKMEKSS